MDKMTGCGFIKSTSKSHTSGTNINVEELVLALQEADAPLILHWSTVYEVKHLFSVPVSQGKNKHVIRTYIYLPNGFYNPSLCVATSQDSTLWHLECKKY